MQFFKRKLTEPFVSEIQTDDVPAVASIHDESFARGWNKAELTKMLGASHTFGLVLREEGKPDQPPLGFVIYRQVADEAEILSIATGKAYRNQGIGRHLMDAAIRKLQADRRKSLFLEVDENNSHAISLYRKIGFRTAGKREGYYRASPSTDDAEKPAAALVMHLDL